MPVGLLYLIHHITRASFVKVVMIPKTFKETLTEAKRATPRERYGLASAWHFERLRHLPSDEIEEIIKIAAGFDPDELTGS